MSPPTSSFKIDSMDNKIVAYIKKEDWPVTTEMVAKELEISWNTAQLHLYKLQAEGILRGKRVGRQNQWMLTDKGSGS
jgi:predicted ArsR family transcriptional regulator